MSEQRAIVVGVDTSGRTDAWLEWAVREARARRAPLRLVCGYDFVVPFANLSVYLDLRKLDVDHAKRIAERALNEAELKAAELDPGVEVSVEAIDGEAVPTLLAESLQAQTVVLGSRRLGAAGSIVLGSVSTAVAARAACPAVVVRGAVAADQAQPVVVGVDGTRGSETVLEYAFGYASAHGAPLHAVLCWQPNLLAPLVTMPAGEANDGVKAWLSEALAGWREKFPDVAVTSAVVENHPTAGLTEAAAAAQLLVVGSVGRHALAGTLLGSVSQGVLHHAECPVAVVPVHAD